MRPKEIAIKNFVLGNYKLLTRKEIFNRKKYDEIKKAYFRKELHCKFGVPRDKEIYDYLIEVLIKNQRISDIETLERIVTEVPLLKMFNVNTDNYVSLVESTAKKYAMGEEELQKLHPIEQIEKLTDLVKREKMAEIDKLFEQKKEEYRKLPSILDDIDFDEPEIIPEREETKEWWEILDLKENPFPDLQGLFLINKELYSEIIVETGPIKWFLNQLDREKIDIFHKAFLLAGNLGTGKTTLFDYISPSLPMKHIEPIRIALVDMINEAHYIQNFEKQLCTNVWRISKKYAIPTPSKIIDFDEAELIMLELQTRGVKGFLIFLDDLHKHQETIKVFNFMSSLQIEKNNFTRDGINATFVVSGFPSWQDRIMQDSSLTGFFDDVTTLTLPEVTPELAAEVIQKRLKVFSINSEKELNIRDDFFKLIFRKVDSEPKYTNKGFRLYIEEVLRHFREKKFDILTIDFTKLDNVLTQQIKALLESNEDFKEAIRKLIYGGGIKKKEVRELALKILCKIYLDNGVSEQTELFERHKFHFKRLQECSLIQKYKKEETLIWNISPFLKELNKNTIKQFGLSIEDYLVSIYCEPILRVKEEKEENELAKYYKDIKKWEENKMLDYLILSTVKQAVEIYSKTIYPLITTVDQKKLSGMSLPELQKIKECIWFLMKSIIRFESPTIIDICGENNISGWLLRHRKLEYSHQFLQMLKSVENASVQRVDIARLSSFANDSFGELWYELRKSTEIYKICETKCYQLPQNILDIIFREHDRLFIPGYSGKDYFDVLDKFVDVVENSIRKYLFVSALLILGPYHARIKYYPGPILKYIGKAQAPSGISYESFNEFENLNRGQYKFLFLQSGKESEFYRFMIAPIIKYWPTHDIESFFNIFGDINIITSHEKRSFVEQFRKDIPVFLKGSCRFIATLFERLKALITSYNCIIVDNDKTYITMGYQLKYKGEVKRIVQAGEIEDIPECLCKREITNLVSTDNEQKLIENIDSIFNGVQINDITDVEFVKVKFNMDYCEVLSLIAYLIAKNKINVLFPYSDSIFIKRLTPLIQ